MAVNGILLGAGGGGSTVVARKITLTTAGWADNQQTVTLTGVLADEDSLLILAGAGTGKTTTLSAKVKYLVDIKHVDPSKILVMSYTKKATKKKKKRLQDDLDINCDVTTFHSLGYRYIRKIFDNHKCYIVDNNTKDKIFFDFFAELFQDKSIILEMLNAFKDIPGTEWLFSQYFKENYDKYDTYKDFLEGYKQKRLEEISVKY